MNKTLIVGLYENKLQLRIVADQVLDTRDFIATSFITAAFDIREYLHRANHTVKEIILVIDEDARLLRARTESVKSKEDLRALWDISTQDYFAYIEQPMPDGRREYLGLRYTREVIEPYLALAKKLKVTCSAIIPLDFLYLQNAAPTLIISKRAGRTRVKLFDGRGHFFLKNLFNDNPQELEQVILFAEREQYIDPGVVPRVSSAMQYEKALTSVLDVPSSFVLYAEGPREQQRHKKAKLSGSQRMVLVFVLVMLFLAGIPFLQYFLQSFQIKRDIRTYLVTLERLRPRFERLVRIEQRTKNIKKRLEEKPSLKSILDVLPEQTAIREISFDQNTQLLSCVVLIPRAAYERILASWKKLPAVENVNVIYVTLNPRTELKVIIKVRE